MRNVFFAKTGTGSLGTQILQKEHNFAKKEANITSQKGWELLENHTGTWK